MKLVNIVIIKTIAFKNFVESHILFDISLDISCNQLAN